MMIDRGGPKALETEYAGHLFRSRLEARWAVFFDRLGIKWEYEAEGFETSAGNYLPDFKIYTDGQAQWFEVKPADAGYDARHGALATGPLPVVVARGMPRDYRDQLRGLASAITAHVNGLYVRCAFLARRQGHDVGIDPFGEFPPWIPGAITTWSRIGKNGIWHCDQSQDPHLVVWVEDVPCNGSCGYPSDYCGLPPSNCLDFDAAYRAAHSARFGR